MYVFAVVEDNDADYDAISRLLSEYAKTNGLTFRTDRYREAVGFLDDYKQGYDAVFMDIDMPFLNGMDAAEKLRKHDSVVPLIFTTNLANYAVNGYAVDAFDFLVKPLNENGFGIKMDRIMRRLERAEKREITLYGKNDGGGVQFYRVNVDSVVYVEIMNHSLLYHTENGVIDVYGKMKDVEEQLSPYGFFRCNHSYLVNLKFVRRADDDLIYCGDDTIAVSRRKKNAFWTALTEYIGVIEGRKKP